jgi:hypothetical protein
LQELEALVVRERRARDREEVGAGVPEDLDEAKRERDQAIVPALAVADLIRNIAEPCEGLPISTLPARTVFTRW